MGDERDTFFPPLDDRIPGYCYPVGDPAYSDETPASPYVGWPGPGYGLRWKDPEPPTWTCEYCGNANRGEQLTCGDGCGAARPEEV